MLAFHLLYDLHTYGPSHLTAGIPPDFWNLAPIPIGSTFLFVVGLTMSLPMDSHLLFRRLKRVFLSALLITVVTSVFTPRMPVYFGILHCIAASQVLVFYFRNSPRILGILGMITLVGGIILRQSSRWIFLSHLNMGDYYPLLPYCSATFFGCYMGHAAKSLFVVGDINNKKKTTRALMYLGQHSLIIYLLNQPLFLAILFIFGLM